MVVGIAQGGRSLTMQEQRGSPLVSVRLTPTARRVRRGGEAGETRVTRRGRRRRVSGASSCACSCSSHARVMLVVAVMVMIRRRKARSGNASRRRGRQRLKRVKKSQK